MNAPVILRLPAYLWPMVLHPLVGHLGARRQLAQAVATHRVPQLLLLLGPHGVGKQRFALWLAQLLHCERPAAEPCGACRPCQLVQGLSHPDVHWITPVLRPKAVDPDKQVEELEEALAGVVTQRRAQPFYGAPDGMAGHFVTTARLLLRRASLTPVEGRLKVFILAEAERLVPQESSQEAANALLKLLEEPPADSHFILTGADAQGVLPTIRSRAIPIRLGRLSDAEVSDFLGAYLKPTPGPDQLRERVARAGGSIGVALNEDDDAARARQAAHAFLASVMGGRNSRGERALGQVPWAARGDFTAMLDALAETLGDGARASLGQPAIRPLPRQLLGDRSTDRLVRATEQVLAAREIARGNVNPQLLVAALAEELAEIL